MNAHSSLAFLSGLLACAACGGSSAPNPATDVTQAKSTLPRDPASSIPASVLQGAVSANNAFAVDLYSHVRASSPAGNLLTSPLSASLALTMTYAGAKGQTATQMTSALHYGSAGPSIFDGQNALSAALASRAASALAADQHNASESQQAAPSPDNYALEVVNSLWGEQSYSWEQPFLDTMAKSYGTGVFTEDFVHQFDPARVAINTWVSSATADKINNLLPPGSVDDTTRMVLVNAVHLKFPWASSFATSQTANADFTTTAGSNVSTPFMNQQLTAAYDDDGQAQIVALPLYGNDLAVVVALPHGDLGAYEDSLAAGSGALVQPSQQALVQLSLPKVNFTSPSFSLADSLKAMGMTQAFDRDAADFTGLCANTPDGLHLYISDVLQKAMVGMQETGVEAAAATAVLVAGSTAVGPQPPMPVSMVVNRPFVVSIVDVLTGAVLFLGHIEDPTQAGSE